MGGGGGCNAGARGEGGGGGGEAGEGRRGARPLSPLLAPAPRRPASQSPPDPAVPGPFLEPGRPSLQPRGSTRSSLVAFPAPLEPMQTPLSLSGLSLQRRSRSLPHQRPSPPPFPRTVTYPVTLRALPDSRLTSLASEALPLTLCFPSPLLQPSQALV